MEQRELEQLASAHKEVVDMVSGNKISLEEVSTLLLMLLSSAVGGTACS